MATEDRGTARPRVFVDSSAFLSLVSTRDQHHSDARRIWTSLTEQQARTFTSNFVVAETHALFLTRLGRQRAVSFLEGIGASSMTILRLSPQDEIEGRRIVVGYDDKDFSLTDATSFAVMQRLRIPHAFAFDKNFEQYGLRVL